MSILKSAHQPPSWLLFMRIAQAVVAVIVLGTTAYVFSFATYWVGSSITSNYFPGLPFAFFAFAWTVLFLIFALFFSRKLPITAKPLLIMIILEAITTVWWLVTFALLADEASGTGSTYTTVYYKRSIAVRGYNTVADANAADGCLKAAAGLGALEFLLFVASLVVISMEAHRASRSSAKSVAQATGDGYSAGPHNESATHTSPVYDPNSSRGPPPTQQYPQEVQQQGQYNPQPQQYMQNAQQPGYPQNGHQQQYAPNVQPQDHYAGPPLAQNPTQPLY